MRLPPTGNRNEEEDDNMVSVHATATEPSVLTSLLKQTQLFMRAKSNQTVGMAEKNMFVKSFF